jgi:hypothetical protein
MAQGHQSVTGKKARAGFSYTKAGKKNSKPKAASKNKKGGK